MTKDEFVAEVAKLVAGMQAPVSLAPHTLFGAAYEPWEKLYSQANGGFGWTNAEKCEEAFRKILADE